MSYLPSSVRGMRPTVFLYKHAPLTQKQMREWTIDAINCFVLVNASFIIYNVLDLLYQSSDWFSIAKIKREINQ